MNGIPIRNLSDQAIQNEVRRDMVVALFTASINFSYDKYCQRGDVVKLSYSQFIAEYIGKLDELVFNGMINSGRYNE